MKHFNRFYKELGLLIGKKRTEKNISQDKLASIIGVDRTTINRWENGRIRPKTECMKKICDVLDIDYDKYMYLATERAAQTRTEDVSNFFIKDTIRVPLYDDVPMDKLFAEQGFNKFITVSSHLLDTNVKYFALTMRFKTLNYDVGDVLLFEQTDEYTEKSILCVSLKGGLYVIPPHLVKPTNAKVIGRLRRALITYEH